MQIFNANAVESIELAGGASHRVRSGTLTTAGAVIFGELTPVLTFTDDETGEMITVPRHAVVGFGGDGALTEPDHHRHLRHRIRSRSIWAAATS